MSRTCTNTSSCDGNLKNATNEATIITRLTPDILVMTVGASAVFFALAFWISWVVFQKYFFKKFVKHKTLTRGEKADCVARVGSCLHTIIIVPMILFYLYKCQFDYGGDYEPLQTSANNLPVQTLQITFSITVGYFVADLILTIGFFIPYWPAFALHHVIAGYPFAAFLFFSSCNVGSYVMAGMLLVESSNVSLHSMHWLEETGSAKTWLYTSLLYATVALFAVTRIIMPVHRICIMHWCLPMVTEEQRRCLLIPVVCAYLILGFCLYFFTLLIKEKVMMTATATVDGGAQQLQDALQRSPSPSLLSRSSIIGDANDGKKKKANKTKKTE